MNPEASTRRRPAPWPSGPADGEGFIDSLMSRLSLEEKIGQLNLPVGGDVVSGTARSTGIDSLILAGRIGGFFNVKGVGAVSACIVMLVGQCRSCPHGPDFGH